jgi:hypothetical protein
MEFFRQNFRLTLSKREGLSTADLHLPNEKEQNAYENNHQKRCDENTPEREGLLFFLHIDNHPFISEKFNHLGVFRGISFEASSFFIPPNNVSTAYLRLLNPIVFHGGDEIGIIFFYRCLTGFTEKLEEKNHQDDDNCPEDQVLIKRTQKFSSDIEI